MNLIDQNADDVLIQLSKSELRQVISIFQERLAESAQSCPGNEQVDEGLKKIARMVIGLDPSRVFH